MRMKKINEAIWLIGLTIVFAGCNPNDWLVSTQPQPTPTLMIARFATPTVTSQPTETPTIVPSQTPTLLPSATNTISSQVTASPPPSLTPIVTSTSINQPEVTPTVEAIPPTTTTAPIEPTGSVPTLTPLSGRIAFPVDNGGGFYDIWVVELPLKGGPYLIKTHARQPDFAADGRLLVKAQGGDLGESIGLLGPDNTWLGIVNESPEDSFPFWHPDNTRYTYSNGNLVKDPDTAHLATFIFTTCSLQIPRNEGDLRCQDTVQWGYIEVGDAPVWTADDRIVYFSYKGADGLYMVDSASMLRAGGGLEQQRLLIEANGRPTDTFGEQIFFSAGNIEGNWEAYTIDLNGENLINHSQSPESQDGLPTVSPDGDWVAFVSDRGGSWGIWVIPRTGGEATRVVDFSKINSNHSPWGTGNREWLMERISWGP